MALLIGLEVDKMIFGRNAKTQAEKDLILKCYKAGMFNNWANGEYARQDGNFIVEEDRLNKNSICFIDNKTELKKFFKDGNWCLGQGVIHKNMFFLQQVNGGDEWASYRIDDNLRCWDSISWGRIIKSKEWTKYYKEFAIPKTKEEYYKEVA